MAIESIWADVPVVKGSDVYGIGADFITAQMNTEQNEALQSRDLFLFNKFKEYYTQNQIDNLFSSYTTNLDWKESVETYDEILEKYPTDLSMYNWIEIEPKPSYEELLNLYPIDYNNLIWQESVANYKDISTKYPTPEHNWAVEVTSTGEKYKYDSANNVWNKTIAAPENNQGIIVDDGTKYVFNSEKNKWILLDAPPQDGWTINVKDTNYTYRYDINENKWIAISANAIPLATEEVDGLLSKEDYAYIRQIESDILPKIYLKMNQIEERALPLGSIIPYVNEGSNPPLGFVFAEGGLYLRTDYPDLWDKIQDSVIDDSDRDKYPGRFTNGDGEGTFRVPDLRGSFLRGLDFNKGLDPEREVGSYQNDAISEHAHETEVTGVGSIDDNAIEDNRLVIAGTTQNDYSAKSIIRLYSSNEAETRPKNVAFRFIVKVIPSDKLPTITTDDTPPTIVRPIDADYLNGHVSSLSAAEGAIPVAGPNGKLDNSWFNIDLILDDTYVKETETSEFPDSNKIPYSNSASNLDDWLSIVTIEDVDRWISYLYSDTDYNEDISQNFEDKEIINKKFVTKLKFTKFLIALRQFIKTFKQVYTTEEIEPTNERGYISNSERVKYSDKYTKNETYQLLYNFLRSYIPLSEATEVPTPNKIPIANEEGKLDPGWMSDLFLNKLGENDITGYVEVANNEVNVSSGIVDSTRSGNVTITGGGTYSLADLSPAKTIISGYDNIEEKGGNVEIYAGTGGLDPSSIGGSVIIQSGSGSAYDGTVDLNNIKISKNNTIYTNESEIILKQNNGITETNYLNLSSGSLTYMHDNLVNDSDDYRLQINKDGTVESNKLNIPNSFTILNDKGIVPFDNLPKTVLVNNIGEFSRTQIINTTLGNVIYGEIKQNTVIDIDDGMYSNLEAKELTIILKVFGFYNVEWPINITWISGSKPVLDIAENNIIKLFRIGNGEWIGWKVGDGNGTSNEILINDTEVPPDEFEGKIHIYVESEELVPEPEREPDINLSGLVFGSTSDNAQSFDANNLVMKDLHLWEP